MVFKFFCVFVLMIIGMFFNFLLVIIFESLLKDILVFLFNVFWCK